MRKTIVSLTILFMASLGTPGWSNDRAFWDAVRRGDLNTVNVAVAKRPELVKAREPKIDTTALHIAASRGHAQIVSRLLQLGASVNARDARGATPLHYAVGNGHVQVVRTLLAKGADPNAVMMHGSARLTPLHIAVMRGRQNLVSLLLQNGASVRGDGATVLHTAASYGQAEAVRALIQAGADPKTAEPEVGYTPLHVAAANGRVNVAQTLKPYYRSVDVRSRFGQTPLHAAAAFGHTAMIDWLVRHRADVNARDDMGTTPLMMSALMGQVGAAKRLLELGANPNAQDLQAKTPLHYAAESTEAKAEHVVRVLLAHGARLDLRDRQGQTALQTAQRRANKRLAELLKHAKKQ